MHESPDAESEEAALPIGRFANFPFAPASFPFFYGWMIVIVSTLGIIMSLPGQTMGVGPFNVFLARDLHLTINDLTTAYMYGTLGSAALLPWVSPLFDRFGSRVMVVVSSLSLGATLLYLSRCDQLARAVEAWFESSWAAQFAVMTTGFFLVRFWGQGVLTIVTRNMLGKWFDRRRGMATAISGVFVSGTFAYSPSFVLDLMGEDKNWSRAWEFFAIACVIWAFLGWVFYRDNPEECGLKMDGPNDDERPQAIAPPMLHEFGTFEALKTYAFWGSALPLALYALLGTAVTFHLISIGELHGLDASDSVGVYRPMTAVAISINLVGGWLSDRVRTRWLLVALLLGQAVGCFGLMHFGEVYGHVLLVAGFGLASVLFPLLMTIVWPRFFGRTHLGAISGMNMAMSVAGGALGPKFFAMEHQETASFDTSFSVCMIVAMVLVVFVLGVENPQLKRDRQ